MLNIKTSASIQKTAEKQQKLFFSSFLYENRCFDILQSFRELNLLKHCWISKHRLPYKKWEKNTKTVSIQKTGEKHKKLFFSHFLYGSQCFDIQQCFTKFNSLKLCRISEHRFSYKKLEKNRFLCSLDYYWRNQQQRPVHPPYLFSSIKSSCNC